MFSEYAQVWVVKCCNLSSDMTESHLMSGGCPVYGDLIENFGDLTEDNN